MKHWTATIIAILLALTVIGFGIFAIGWILYQARSLVLIFCIAASIAWLANWSTDYVTKNGFAWNPKRSTEGESDEDRANAHIKMERDAHAKD